MTARRHRLLGVLLIVAAGPLLAASPAAAERARIAAERQAIEARFAAEEAACRERFVVTSCVDAVRARKREALAVPRQQELQLDDAERRRRAAARAEAVEARRAAAAALPPVPPPLQSTPRTALPPAGAASRAPRAANEATEARAAAERALAASKRREAVASDRARIEERQAERAASGKKAAPLPLPEAASRPGH